MAKKNNIFPIFLLRRPRNPWAFGIMLVLSLPLRAIEYEIEIDPVEYLQKEFLNGAQVRSGLWGKQAVGLAADEYQRDADTELLLAFNSSPTKEILQSDFAYKVIKNGVEIQNSQWYRGEYSGLFLPGQSLELDASQESLFAPAAVWNDFSMEFWIYPAEFSSGEELFQWKGRSWLDERPRVQQFTVRAEDGRLQWILDNFFIRLSYNDDEAVELNYESHTLSSRRELVPRTWSHHLLRYDSQRGVLEYLINGISEAIAHLTDSGRESGAPFLPHIGEESNGRLNIGGSYHGFMDDFRIQRNWVEQPNLSAVRKNPGYAIIGPIDLKYDGSRVTGLNALYRKPGNSDVLFSFLQQENTYLSEGFVNFSTWLPLQPGEYSNENTSTGFGRYIFLRIDFLPDGSPHNIPLVQDISLRYESDPAPPSPQNILIQTQEESISLSWNRVMGAEGYLLYYGASSGHYFGRDSSLGASPVDLGNVAEIVVEGLITGKMYYFRIASYDQYNSPERGLYLERKLSGEVFARPSRVYQ